MDKNEIKEIRQRIKKESATFQLMCGCYVNSEKNIVTEFEKTFVDLPEEEIHKYIEIASKTLSGKKGDNLIELPFPMEAESDGGSEKLLIRLRDSGLKDDDIRHEFYNLIINNYARPDNYLILVYHDIYDVPMKTSDNMELDDSEDIYDYLITAICPVELSKPGIGYYPDSNSFTSLERDWVVGLPESGFLFPAFTERMADVHSVLFYTKDTKEPHTELWEDAFQCKSVRTSTQKKNTFTSIISEALGDPDDDKVKDSFAEVESTLNTFLETEKKIREKDDPIIMTKDDLKPILADSGIDDMRSERIASKYEAAFQEERPGTSEIIDSKILKDSGPRLERKDRMKQVSDLNKKLTESGIVKPDGKEADVIVKVPDDTAEKITATFIDGQRCLLIPLEGNEEMMINGEKKDL